MGQRKRVRVEEPAVPEEKTPAPTPEACDDDELEAWYAWLRGPFIARAADAAEQAAKRAANPDGYL